MDKPYHRRPPAAPDAFQKLADHIVNPTASRPVPVEPRPLCSECGDAARKSLAQEIRDGLKARGLWAPENSSDLITAIFKAIEDAQNAPRIVPKPTENWKGFGDFLKDPKGE